MYGERHAVDRALAGVRVEQCQAGEEGDAAAAGCAQLLLGSRQIVGFAEYLPIAEYGDLIRADYQMIGVAVGECAGFFFGQALDQVGGRLVLVSAFIDARRLQGEGQLQAIEQLATVG